ncbi:hypothetical protein [Thauera sinica]|uniref:Lipoprotein n=1 Tax=Thauera sinica TaxID=2665146 RepID=A0ABW1AU43_9RHOO|nr:hypothetical protein [Thauera sp. K11]
MRKKRWIVVLLMALLGLPGCSGGGFIRQEAVFLLPFFPIYEAIENAKYERKKEEERGYLPYLLASKGLSKNSDYDQRLANWLVKNLSRCTECKEIPQEKIIDTLQFVVRTSACREYFQGKCVEGLYNATIASGYLAEFRLAGYKKHLQVSQGDLKKAQQMSESALSYYLDSVFTHDKKHLYNWALEIYAIKLATESVAWGGSEWSEAACEKELINRNDSESLFLEHPLRLSRTVDLPRLCAEINEISQDIIASTKNDI